MNSQQLMTVLKHAEIAKSQLIDCDKILYSLEINKLQEVIDTIMHLEFYCPEQVGPIQYKIVNETSKYCPANLWNLYRKHTDGRYIFVEDFVTVQEAYDYLEAQK